MKKSCDRTYPWSPAATMNGRDLTLLAWKQTCNQEYNGLTAVPGACQDRTHATLPKAFHEEPGRMLSWGRHTMWRRLKHTPKISQKFAGEWNYLFCSATAGTKTALGIIQVWFNYFAASFFNALGKVNVKCLPIWLTPPNAWPGSTIVLLTPTQITWAGSCCSRQ